MLAEMEEVRPKPQICRNTDKILKRAESAGRIEDRAVEEQVRRHENCYFGRINIEDLSC